MEAFKKQTIRGDVFGYWTVLEEAIPGRLKKLRVLFRGAEIQEE